MKRRIFPQLDGMRGAAALLILAHHYWPGWDLWDPTGGRIGVDFFFVLSGYLITRSLLLDRQFSTESRLTVLTRFYTRRAWRILPLFYVVCAMAIWRGWMTTGNGMFWHLSFLSNFYFIKEGRFVGPAGHLWAVAVEQHFYLFWPLILLFVPKRHLRAATLAMIGTAVLCRAAAGLLGWPKLTIDLLTTDAFESLGAGSFLACSEESGSLMGALGLILTVIRFACRGSAAGGWLSLTGTELSRSLLLAWLIACGVRGIHGWAGRWLESTPGRALGHWSFAVYLSHNFVMCLTVAELGGQVSEAILPFIALSLTLGWSMAAYHLIEKPLAERRRTDRSVIDIPISGAVLD